MTPSDTTNGQAPASTLNPAGMISVDAAATPVFVPAPTMPNTKEATVRYYFCPTPSNTMNRHDGKRLIFQYGVYATNVKGDIDYLDHEVEEGGSKVFNATKEQIDTYLLHIDLVGTIKRQTIAELTQVQIDAIRADAEAKVAAEYDTALAQFQSEQGDGINLAGVDLKARLAALSTLRAGGGVVKLGGITGSDAIKDGAANSGV